MTWLFDRLKETSTWAALLGVITSATGYVFAPELSEYITSAALGVVGIVAFFVKEDK